jgi:hypothetical protein
LASGEPRWLPLPQDPLLRDLLRVYELPSFSIPPKLGVQKVTKATLAMFSLAVAQSETFGGPIRLRKLQTIATVQRLQKRFDFWCLVRTKSDVAKSERFGSV